LKYRVIFNNSRVYYTKFPIGYFLFFNLYNNFNFNFNFNSKIYFSNIIDFIDIEEIIALFEIKPPFKIYYKKSHFILSKIWAKANKTQGNRKGTNYIFTKLVQNYQDLQLIVKNKEVKVLVYPVILVYATILILERCLKMVIHFCLLLLIILILKNRFVVG
jgi:hypothetical protein